MSDTSDSSSMILTPVHPKFTKKLKKHSLAFPAKIRESYGQVLFNLRLFITYVKNNLKDELYETITFKVSRNNEDEGFVTILKKQDITLKEAIIQLLNYENLPFISNEAHHALRCTLNEYYKAHDPELQPTYPDVVFIDRTKYSTREEVLEHLLNNLDFSIVMDRVKYMNVWGVVDYAQQFINWPEKSLGTPAYFIINPDVDISLEIFPFEIQEFINDCGAEMQQIVSKFVKFQELGFIDPLGVELNALDEEDEEDEYQEEVGNNQEQPHRLSHSEIFGVTTGLEPEYISQWEYWVYRQLYGMRQDENDNHEVELEINVEIEVEFAENIDEQIEDLIEEDQLEDQIEDQLKDQGSISGTPNTPITILDEDQGSQSSTLEDFLEDRDTLSTTLNSAEDIESARIHEISPPDYHDNESDEYHDEIEYVVSGNDEAGDETNEFHENDETTSNPDDESEVDEPIKQRVFLLLKSRHCFCGNLPDYDEGHVEKLPRYDGDEDAVHY